MGKPTAVSQVVEKERALFGHTKQDALTGANFTCSFCI